jgi:penicillin amidase
MRSSIILLLSSVAALPFASGFQGRAETESQLAAEARSLLARIEGRIAVAGLREPVEVLRDEWGVPHIYAKNSEDLFFAQGFVAAQDRLYQMELWRRTAAGELAEVLGPDYIHRDRAARLMRYRGDMQAEWESYAPDARPIAEAFVRGINAFVRQCGDRLPIEFRLQGFRPGEWKAAHCLLRHSFVSRSRNIAKEVARAEMVTRLGVEATMKYMPTNPPRKLDPDPALSLQGIDASVLRALQADSGPATVSAPGESNNWVVDGTLTTTGKPLLAVDPHQQVGLPGPRYVTHLVAPGWNVIGSGEPYLPGVARGHNQWVAFGFTTSAFDQADLYVEKTQAGNANRYLYRGNWVDMRIEREEIRVKGRARPEVVELKFTVHGPVIHEDPARRRAIALRWVGNEPGAQVYLGALSLDRVRNWGEFRAAAERWKMPSENIVYADTAGNIGWVAAGLLPIRRNWSGLLPVPGDTGAYEWDGFRKVAGLPWLFNPKRHFIVTANSNNIPPDYANDIGFDWDPAYRYRRIEEVLGRGGKFTVRDFERLQHDETSLPARELIAMLDPPDRGILAAWDAVMSRDSGPAALFELWLGELPAKYAELQAPAEGRKLVSANLELPVLIRLLQAAPRAVSRRILNESLRQALVSARERMGEDPRGWRWGTLHKAWFRHPLANTPARRAVFNPGPVERGGDRLTVNATTPGSGFEQRFGATYRQIVDLADWDRSVFTNVPGQSGQPGSPHYSDLLPLWAEGKYASLRFTRQSVERHARHKLILGP